MAAVPGGPDAKVVAEAAALSCTVPAAAVAGKTITVRAFDFFENGSEPSAPVAVKST